MADEKSHPPASGSLLVLTQAVLDGIFQPAMVLDAAGNLLQVNRAAVEFLQMGNLVGRNLDSLPTPVNLLSNQLKHAQETGRSVTENYQGTLGARISEFHARIVPDQGSGYFLALLSDSTPVRSLETRNRSLQAFLTELVAHMPVGYLGIGRDLSVREFNRAAEKMFERTGEQLIGMPVKELIPAEFSFDRLQSFINFQDSPARFYRMAAGGPIHCFKNDMSFFPALGSVLKVEYGGDILFIIFLQDISQLKEMESTMLRNEHKFQKVQRFEAIGMLAGNIAHEFNNLLTIFKFNAETLEETLEGEDRQIVQDILKAVDRGTSLTQQILKMARAQETIRHPVDLVEYIAREETLLKTAAGKAIKLQLIFDTDRAMVSANASELSQVLLNLVGNSRDAITDHGTITIRLGRAVLDEQFFVSRSWPAVTGHYFNIRVTDDGCGIPEQELGKIFEPFYTKKNKDVGTGLGLPVVYGIIKQHDGYIEVSSKPGEGTVIDMYLPQLVVQSETGGTDISKSLLYENEKLLKDKVIAVVDDEPQLLELVSRQLKKAGMVVYSFASGETFLGFLDSFEGKLDFLLIDYILPERNGYEISLEMKLMQPETRIFFMSGFINDPQVQMIIMRSPERLLMKPFRKEDLLAKLAQSIAP